MSATDDRRADADVPAVEGPGRGARRAPTRGPRPSRAALVAVLVASAVVVGGLVGSVVYVIQGGGRTRNPREADDFVRYIALGEDVDSQRDGEGRCGYELAWSLMTPRLQEELPYIVFLEDLVIHVERCGPVRDYEAVVRGRYQRGGFRLYDYRLRCGGADENIADMTACRLVFHLLRHDEKWAVDRFSFELENALESR
jgi:hypothetical protein